jgi:hypothetical protein
VRLHDPLKFGSQNDDRARLFGSGDVDGLDILPPPRFDSTSGLSYGRLKPLAFAPGEWMAGPPRLLRLALFKRGLRTAVL